MAFGSGAPAKEDEGKSPRDPGMTELSSERLVCETEKATTVSENDRQPVVPPQ